MTQIRTKVIAVNFARGPTITLRSGAELDLLDPWSSNFTIDDIAHGLAHICRYAGQCEGFYSVAEHSLLVSEIAHGFEYEALMHDSAEAFLGDVTRPLKHLLPEYKRIESGVEDAIFDRFKVDRASRAIVKAADLRVLAAEQAQIMPRGTDAWANEAGITPAPITVRFLPPMVAKQKFVERFRQLTKN